MNLLDRDGRRFMGVRISTIILTVVGALGITGLIAYSCANKTVFISDNGAKIQIKTVNKTVKDALAQTNIKIGKYDIITPSLDQRLVDGANIEITRAVPVNLVVNGQERSIITGKKTVGDVLAEQKIALEHFDKLNVDLLQTIYKDILIRIVKIKEETITETEQIAFDTSETRTTKISRGSTRVLRPGQEGLKEKTYKVTYEDNNVISKILLDEKVVSKPVSSLVEVGVEPLVHISRGENVRYARELKMTATAYTAGFESTGKRPGQRGYGRTATGAWAQRGIVAVDPSVIPLGTKLFVESTDGFSNYGYAIAADTGGAIKGNRIDLFYDTVSEARTFGRRQVKVYVIED